MARSRPFLKKKVLITGGSSGIGLASAKALSEEGAEVILAARDQKKLNRAAESLKGKASTCIVDVSDAESVRKLSGDVKRDHGRVDILINSAGIVEPLVLGELPVGSISEILDTDLKGTMITVKEILPLMGAGGHVVNISSMAGIIGLYGYTAYSAAKFGVLGFSEALRMELKPAGIGVSVVFPPDTATPQLEHENRTKPEELRSISSKIHPIPPDKVASAIMDGIRKERFMIFPDMRSRMTYIAYRLGGPLLRAWMDGRIGRVSPGSDVE